MNKATSYGFVSVCAILAMVFIGDQAVRSEDEPIQSETYGTNVDFSDDAWTPLSDTNVVVNPEESTGQPAMTADIEPNSPVAKLGSLVQAGVEKSVILAYISNTPRFFNLDAEDIIYLNDLGAPAEIIEAVMEHDRQLLEKGIAPNATPQANASEAVAELPPATLADTNVQPPEVTVDYFYDTLAPYGLWLNIEGYGRCWRPAVLLYNPDWRPYCDNGHWVYTDHGWYWLSGYSWGWGPFHYGRWFHHSRYGWCWWPDTTWASSWVCWRYDRDYCGWAPLPPYTVYRSGIGFVYRGNTVSVGFNFGLNVNSFTFVSLSHFCDQRPWRYRLRDRDATQVYNRTTIHYGVDYDRHNRVIVNTGIPPRDITAVTRQEIHPVSIRHERNRITGSNRYERLDRDGRTLIVNRPDHRGTSNANTSHVANQTEHQRRTFQSTVPRNDHTATTRSGIQTPYNTETRTAPRTTSSPQAPSERTKPRTSQPGYNQSNPPSSSRNASPHVAVPRSQQGNNAGGATPDSNSSRSRSSQPANRTTISTSGAASHPSQRVNPQRPVENKPQSSLPSAGRSTTSTPRNQSGSNKPRFSNPSHPSHTVRSTKSNRSSQSSSNNSSTRGHNTSEDE